MKYLPMKKQCYREMQWDINFDNGRRFKYIHFIIFIEEWVDSKKQKYNDPILWIIFIILFLPWKIFLRLHNKEAFIWNLTTKIYFYIFSSLKLRKLYLIFFSCKSLYTWTSSSHCKMFYHFIYMHRPRRKSYVNTDGFCLVKIGFYFLLCSV